MAKKYLVFLDDGHGSETPGKRSPFISEIGRSIKENEFNSAVVNILKPKLTAYGIHVVLVAPSDADTPLLVRTNTANRIYKEYVAKYGKDNVLAIYVSVHYDAFDSAFNNYDPEGLTVFVQTGNINKNSGRLAKCINKYLAQGTKQQNRGVKEGNYHVLRETLMPAILSENGFMDNKREALLMVDKKFQNEVATEHAMGILEYFGLLNNSNINGGGSPPKVQSEEKKKEGITLTENGRKACREIIKKAVADKTFKDAHKDVEKYDDDALVSYAFIAINAKLK